MKLDDVTHYQILKILTEHPAYTQREIAAAMGLSLGKTNFCLNALIDKGLVKVGNFRRNRDKRVYAYLLTPQGIEDKARMTIHFLQRKMAEYDALKTEIESLRREVQEIADVGVELGGTAL
ncbi:MarR family EPS-associated transcriptional regulator [Acidithiobacillus sp. CV18-2]|nr:MarR family EPS-associated transcriptional regulator [Acidithiobacillus sp. CV18-3]MBU2757182.1 MarR family EPS-associated transcriptional regulator [Acidithiobacillus sp. BN09-2]MBU2776980.1 MarR family EPS-associated transcriptional regulator [Acidithiobacillus sp. CV18-2]MBU2800212.1 MarR family EPS-associated transcriptional regulator [Acidithiobacillus sp. VAN18-4]